MTNKSQGLKTKIVCTLGPASRDAETVRRMVAAGMDVARINSSHCDIGEMREFIRMVSMAEDPAQRRIGVMLDLQGPRLRVGSIQGSKVELKPGQDFVITTEQKRGDTSRVSVSYQDLAKDLKPGDRVLVDDGLIRLRVKSAEGGEVVCEVVDGGALTQGKGMNFPDSNLRIPAFTERDRRFLEAGLEEGIDWVAQSFVRSAGDVEVLKEAIVETGYVLPVMAKIEKREAVENIESILEVCDGVMIARGDLGVELPIEEVPIVQKELVSKSMHAARPVVTATQMLESMVSRPRPTRAEASDVANAILDGTDAVMLSAESAIGSYPVRTVETLAGIAARAERALDYSKLLEDGSRYAHGSTAGALGYAACKIASDLDASAIITITRSGYTARMVARYRPRNNLIVASEDAEVVDMMTLVWGALGVVFEMSEEIEETMDRVCQVCLSRNLVSAGDEVVITGGFLDEVSGTTNLVHVHTVGGPC
jgi:pyruvate kinase